MVKYNGSDWSANDPIAKLPSEIAGCFRVEARYMREDLLRHRYKVVLKDAEPMMHSGHKIRAVESENAQWYKEFLRLHQRGRPTKKRAQKEADPLVNAEEVLSALGRIEAGRDKVPRVYLRRFWVRTNPRKKGDLVPREREVEFFVNDYRLREFIHGRLVCGYSWSDWDMLPNNDVRMYFGMDPVRYPEGEFGIAGTRNMGPFFEEERENSPNSRSSIDDHIREVPF